MMVDPFGLKFKELTQAMFGSKGKKNGALDRLLKRDFRTEKVTFGKLKENSLECKLQMGK